MSKPIQQFDTDEVCIWLHALGLGSKIGPFRENAVDGDLLCTMGPEDLNGVMKEDLGLSGLQAKKVFRGIEKEKSLAGGGGADPAVISQLQAENANLKNQIAHLQAKIEAAQGSQQPPPPQQRAPPPQQPVQHQPPPPPQRQRQGPGVIGGAAGGALGGAAKGAIMGAILPGMDASDGAKAGAAVGAFSGGTRALGRRRRRF